MSYASQVPSPRVWWALVSVTLLLACGTESNEPHEVPATGGSGATAASGGSSGSVAGTNASGGAGGTSSPGGTSGNSGASSGGGSGTGGSSGASGGTAGRATGGSSAGGSSTGGSSTGGTAGTGGTPDIGPGPCGCATPAGEFGTVSSTISVDSGEVYDGQCRIYRADPEELGDGSQAEGQSPIFEVESGGTLRNVVIGASGADGIHVSGNVTLENVHWLDIGEDALTVAGSSGTVTINCGSAANSADKVFQVNTASTLRISNFTVRSAGKFIRQNGGTTFRVDVFIDHSDVSDMSESVFRTDSSTSHVTFTNSRYSDLGEGLFIFGNSTVNGNSDQSTVSNNEEY